MRMIRDSRRRALLGMLVSGAAVPACWSAPATAQTRAAASDYPSKPLRIVVTFAAGSATDIMTRHLLPSMTQSLGQPIVVENRVGAAGVIGAENVMRSAADGYSIAMSAVSAFSIAAAIRAHNLPYDIGRDFTPIGRACTSTNVVVVHPSVPARSLGELIEYSKTVAGGVRFASGGIGGSNHLAGELIALRTGARLTHVPYSNQGQAVTDVVAGHVPMLIYTVAVLPHVRAGRLRALAVTSEQRQKQLPEVPTAIEQGAAGVVANSWFGLFGPARLPDAIRDKLFTALRDALAVPEVETRLLDTGLAPAPLAPAEFRAFIERDTATWREVVKAAGIKAE